MKLPPEIMNMIAEFRKDAFREACIRLEKKLTFPQLLPQRRSYSTPLYVFEIRTLYTLQAIVFTFDYMRDIEGYEYLNRAFYSLPERIFNHVLIDEKTYFKLDDGRIKRIHPLY